jgi:hypothetical protein
MDNTIVWDANAFGGSLRELVDFDRKALSIVGAAGLDPDGYRDDEKGYDGWELHGYFNGEVFNIYERWGQMRIGGSDALDVEGLKAALTIALDKSTGH